LFGYLADPGIRFGIEVLTYVLCEKIIWLWRNFFAAKGLVRTEGEGWVNACTSRQVA
jgi:hypothetical protein